MKSSKLVALTLFLAALALVIGSQVYSVDLSAQVKTPEICDNGKDDDGDGAIDGADSDCQKEPGTGCSPGFYKNHLSFWQGQGCGDSAGLTDAQILERLECGGRDSTCGRSAAAALLDACTGCSE